jgi:hypothetical protein
MDAAVAELGRAAPRDQLLFLDQQAFVTATYYLDREQVAPGRLTPEGLIEARLDGRRTIGVLTWRFDGLAFVRDLARVRDALRLPAGTPVWVLALGVECDLGGELGAAGFVLPHLARFGPSVSLLQVRLR